MLPEYGQVAQMRWRVGFTGGSEMAVLDSGPSNPHLYKMRPHYDQERAYWDQKGAAPYSVLSEFDERRFLRWIDWHGYGNVLEQGGGSGGFSRLLSDKPDTWCVCSDISFKMLAHAPSATVQADALRVPFAENTFALVIAAALFHHLPGSERLLLDECFRVLQPGGRVVGYDPNAHCLQNRVFMGGGPTRLQVFSPDERPIYPENLERWALENSFSNFEYRLFSFKYETITFFEALQRYVANPLARGPFAKYLHRWFFWSAVKPK